MDFENIDPADFGASLTGISVNLLVQDVRAEARFLTQVFQRQYQSHLLQLLSDGTYLSHLLAGSSAREIAPRRGL